MEPLTTTLAVHRTLESSPFSFNNYSIALAVLDTSLAMVLAIFITLYIMKRRRLAQPQTELVSPLLDILERVEAALSEGALKETILAEFPNILNAEIKTHSANAEASSTVYEVINNDLTRVSNEAKEALMSLYLLYERVKFGNETPSSKEGLNFIKDLRRLQGLMARSETVVA